MSLSQPLAQLAQDYITYVQRGHFLALLEALYAPDAVSVESVAAPGQERVTSGLDALLAKSQGFDAHHQVHSHQVQGPWAHGQDKFAVRFCAQLTHLESGLRSELDEIIVLTVREGKIVKEEFFS